MNLFDVTFTMDDQYRILDIQWENFSLQKTYQTAFSSFLGQQLWDIFSKTQTSPCLLWNNESFSYHIHQTPHGEYYCYLKQDNHHQYLLKKALDQVSEGIQIYDSNACAVFMNQSSRQISQIPTNVDIQGQHLLDLYALDENISTIITSLKTRKPVINRVDHYKTSDGADVATANSAYPIREGKKLIGAVVFEQNASIVKSQMHKLKNIQKALDSYYNQAKTMYFTGYTFDHIIGSSDQMQKAISLARRIAPQNSNVLLVGETGTGKEVFAQSIHKASSRSHQKFLPINCAAIPDNLIEGLLFGTSKGSFTGSEDRPGYFEEANGGTLFLDELNSMSLHMQSKILRVLQENTLRRLGGQKDIHIDVRVISSCNENPFQAIAENKLRKDLFYRLSTVMIDLPPLREHTEDLEDLIRYHLTSTAYQYVNPLKNIHPKVMNIFREYSWPGNTRELFHVLDYAQNMTEEETIQMEHLPPYIFKEHPAIADNQESHTSSAAPLDLRGETLQTLMDDYEHQILLQALEQCGYNISRTAEALGIRRQSLQYRIRKYGIIV